MTDERRQYQMSRRAESQRETRLRITKSAVELHGTLGPSKTTMSAVAEHAGVRRSTLYRHFPDEAALFEACSAHWAASNPPPDPSGWSAIASPDERLSNALEELYAFYGRTAPMLENLFRDEHAMPIVAERFALFHAYLAAVLDMLLAGRRLRGAAQRRVKAALGHAIAFSSWRSLVIEQGLEPYEASSLMCALVEAARARPVVRDAA
jgi:AcrR family transcriptional regulator